MNIRMRSVTSCCVARILLFTSILGLTLWASPIPAQEPPQNWTQVLDSRFDLSAEASECKQGRRLVAAKWRAWTSGRDVAFLLPGHCTRVDEAGDAWKCGKERIEYIAIDAIPERWSEPPPSGPPCRQRVGDIDYLIFSTRPSKGRRWTHVAIPIETGDEFSPWGDGHAIVHAGGKHGRRVLDSILGSRGGTYKAAASSEVQRAPRGLVLRLETCQGVWRDNGPDPSTCLCARVENLGNDTMTLVTPGDGSGHGWRTPVVTWEVLGFGSVPTLDETLRRDPFRDRLQEGAVFSLKPGTGQVLRKGLPYLDTLPSGQYWVRLHYQNIPMMDWSKSVLGSDDAVEMGRVWKSDPCKLTSNWILLDTASDSVRE